MFFDGVNITRRYKPKKEGQPKRKPTPRERVMKLVNIYRKEELLAKNEFENKIINI